MSVPQVLRFHTDGTGAGLYTEAIDLTEIGPLCVSRASTVEFNRGSQQWEVFDLSGARLFSHRSRQACLDWERDHFNQSSQP